ncbi:hypothetical protein ACF090_34445 [Streptomyces sp. NPDC014892]|uniref:hypothetical protein n=1 Tax=Streptomyces sp. NPDC014892 TaxID=3364930 RepID=UPI0036F99BB6
MTRPTERHIPHSERGSGAARITETAQTLGRVEDHLRLGASLNLGWDNDPAAERIRRLGLELEQRAGRLSGGLRNCLSTIS